MRLLANVEHYGGAVALITVTAPGRDRLPNGEAMTRWNHAAPRHWRDLHRAAAQRAKRRHGAFRMLAWTWEYQRRGALHKHVVVGVDSARELAAAHTYAQALHEMAGAHDFGFVDRGRRTGGRRVLEVIPAQRAARYVAKYLSPLDRETRKPTLSETVTRSDVPPLTAYVSRTLTGSTGMTMRYLRWRRKAYVLKLPAIDSRTGELLSSMADRGAADELLAWSAIRKDDL